MLQRLLRQSDGATWPLTMTTGRAQGWAPCGAESSAPASREIRVDTHRSFVTPTIAPPHFTCTRYAFQPVHAAPLLCVWASKMPRSQKQSKRVPLARRYAIAKKVRFGSALD